MKSYESFRIAFQSSEQAARNAYAQLVKEKKEAAEKNEKYDVLFDTAKELLKTHDGFGLASLSEKLKAAGLV